MGKSIIPKERKDGIQFTIYGSQRGNTFLCLPEGINKTNFTELSLSLNVFVLYERFSWRESLFLHLRQSIIQKVNKEIILQRDCDFDVHANIYGSSQN